MKWFLCSVVLCCIVGNIVCPPVKPDKPQPKEGPARSDEMSLGLQYEKYLREVVNVLEEDESFKKKLEESNVTDIKSGDIAKHLDFVSHDIRSKLDELKRRELDRLNQIRKLLDHKKNVQDGKPMGGLGRKNLPGMGRAIPDVSAKVIDAMLKAQGIEDESAGETHHVDLSNPESFEVEDLKKLIVRATDDLEKIDKIRRGDFKKHEMSKEHMRREKLRQMSEREKKEEEAKQAELKRKHQEHPKIHHPGNRAQLEEVWEKKDGLDPSDFDAKTFFKLHDLDGNGYLDPRELDALFQRELDKAYDPNNPAEDDPAERYEEMNRMREHVEDEVDEDNDGLVSLQEFLDASKTDEFNKDDEWDTIDEDNEWTEEEFQAYEDELRAQQMQYGGVQPGEVNVPADDTLRFQGQDHMQGQPQGQPVEQMQQQDQQAPEISAHQAAQQQAQRDEALRQQEAQRQIQAQEEARRQQQIQQEAHKQQQAQNEAQRHQQAQQEAERLRQAQEESQKIKQAQEEAQKQQRAQEESLKHQQAQLEAQQQQAQEDAHKQQAQQEEVQRLQAQQAEDDRRAQEIEAQRRAAEAEAQRQQEEAARAQQGQEAAHAQQGQEQPPQQ